MTAPTVLIVEDNAITRKMVRVALSREGYAVLEAGDGRTALDLAAKQSPDLILQDLRLPDMDGLELLSRFRRLPGGDQVPIVALSGFLSQVESAHAMGLGLTDFLIKPIEPSRLIQVVRSYVDPATSPVDTAGRGRRILLADDDPMQLKLQKVRLERAGFVVTTAVDGAEALRLARQSPPDGILSDVLMPKLDGFKLCLAIRHDPLLSAIPVVLCSANFIEEQDRNFADRVGASALVVRTPDCAEAITTLLEALERSPGPRPVVPLDDLKPEWTERVTRQLERQTSLNGSLLQRASLQAAILAMMAGLSNSLAGSLEPEAVSNDTLAAVLDAGGVSSGALYLTGFDGRLRFHVESGFHHAGAQGAAAFFGHPELFHCALDTTALIAMPDGSVLDPAAHDFLARAGLRSAVIVPVVARGECLGILLLGSGQRDLGQKDWIIFAESMAGQVGQTIALARAFSRLAASEQRYRTLFSNIPVGLLRTTPDGHIVEANPASVELLGYSDRETLLSANMNAFYADPGDRVRVLDIARRDGRVRGFETRWQTVGGVLWVSLNVRVIEENGETLYEGSFESITERKLAEEQLERQRATLVQTEKLAAMGQLLAGVAHELNNPLSVVVGQTHLLRMGAEGSPLAERAGKIGAAADRCARIVKNFLALARQQPPERSKVRLNAVVTEALELLAYPLRVDGVEVTLDLDPDPPTLWADPHQLHQVVVNLVTNAHHAMGETSAPRRLRIATRNEGRRRVILTVADSGPGVPAHMKERVLEPFFTTKPLGQGTGLGLSLCHGIIEEHGGTIAIDDAPGGGALFRIELPVESPSRPAPAVPRIEEAAGPSGLHILVVDDEVEVAELLQEVLQGHGHHVETARNGQSALDRLGERTYDLILSDVKMPVLDGPGLYREVERRHPGLERRIVFMTGDSLSVDVRQFLERSGMPTLAKPFVPADVIRAINRAAAQASVPLP